MLAEGWGSAIVLSLHLCSSHPLPSDLSSDSVATDRGNETNQGPGRRR